MLLGPSLSSVPRTMADGQAQDQDTSAGLRRDGEGPGGEITTTTTTEQDQLPVFEREAKSRTTSESQGSETVAADVSVTEGSGSQPQTETRPHDSLSEMEELRKLWKSHTMPSTNERPYGGQLTTSKTVTANREQSEEEQGSAEGTNSKEEEGINERWSLQSCCSPEVLKSIVWPGLYVKELMNAIFIKKKRSLAHKVISRDEHFNYL